MANWKHKIKVAHIMNDSALSPAEKGEAMAALLGEKFPSLLDYESDDFDDGLSDVVSAFESITGYDDTTPEEELGDWMGALYDWADSEVEPFGEWPPNKMLWIEPS